MSGDRARSSEPFFSLDIITLDGWSGSGKSTLARALAERLGWAYLDSGAWYRALAWAVLRAGADPAREDEVLATLSRMHLTSSRTGEVAVDGQFPGAALRTPELDRATGLVADHPRARAALNERMRAAAYGSGLGGLVADGRDAGSVIFPEARLKVFVEASLDERARRRAAQRAAPEPAAVREGIAARDRSDGARGASAPSPAAASRVLRNEHLTVEEAVGRLLAWAGETWPQRAAPRGPATPPTSRDASS